MSQWSGQYGIKMTSLCENLGQYGLVSESRAKKKSEMMKLDCDAGLSEN